MARVHSSSMRSGPPGKKLIVAMREVMSRVLCQRERGADFLALVIVCEDGEEDPFD